MFVKLDLELRKDRATTEDCVHILNLDIQDNQDEATIGAFIICDLVALVIILKFMNS